MSHKGCLQHLSQLVERSPCLISLIDDDNLAKTEETKLIDDSPCIRPILSESTLADMRTLDTCPLSSYHKGLSCLLDTAPLVVIQSSDSFSTTVRNFTANQLTVEPLLDLSTPSLSTSEYVNSLTESRPLVHSSEKKRPSNKKYSCLVHSSPSSMHTLAVCNRDVQTKEGAPVDNSEPVDQLQLSRSEPMIPTPSSGLSLTETAISLAKDPTTTKTPFQSLTTSFSGSVPAPSSLSLMAPFIRIGTNDSAAPKPEAFSTALGTRTTEDVIADLRRPLGPRLQTQKSTQESGSLRVQDGFPSSISEYTVTKHQHADPNRELGESEDSTDGDDDIRPSTKARKATERKRRMNAIADQHILTSVERAIKRENGVRPEDEASQSARWLVNQSENREIISTPREYQTELFERAKEKNIIAVLDTGMSPSEVEGLMLTY